LGFLVVINKEGSEGLCTEEEDSSLEFSEQDKTFMQWLSEAAGSHLERLQLDLMWMKALLERDSEEDYGMQEKDRELMQEYYSEDAYADRRNGGRRNTLAKGGGLPGTLANTVKTVHKFVDTSDYTLTFKKADAPTEEVANEVAMMLSIQAQITEAPPTHADPNEWRIDYWALTDIEQFQLLVSSLRMFGITEHLTVDTSILHNFFSGIKATYRGVPFHNFHHALSTMHYASKMAQVANISRVLSPVDLFATVIAALCHDCDHRGFNNAFEMMTRSEIALRYNDYSPLENHHCARAFEVAFTANNNIFQDLAPEMYNIMRKRMIAGILATDMKHHGHHVGLLREFELGEASDSQSQFLIEVMVHAADISNPFMPPDISTRWAECLNREFTQQVQMEEKLGLPVTAFMTGLDNPCVAAKSLLGFMDFVIVPMTSSLFRIFPDLTEPKHFLETNRSTASDILHRDKAREEGAASTGADEHKKTKLATKREREHKDRSSKIALGKRSSLPEAPQLPIGNEEPPLMPTRPSF